VERVAVGLSGGVDSAVTAALLKRAGYEVVGVSMRIWDGRSIPSGPGRHACYGPGEEEDLADARRIAERLDIPFHVVDLREAYNSAVLDFCTERYLSGVTPNPCVRCNHRIKFEGIPACLEAQGVVVDYFATGHYARVEFDAARGRFLLKKGKDEEKEQSYFLYLLNQKQLRGTLLPLGSRRKEEVRALAAELELPVAEKEESQDFISGGYRVLFGGEERPGPIVDESGRVLGEHRGIHRYTVGQRRGLNIAVGKPLYVLSIDRSRNAVVVGPVERLYRSELTAGDLNWIAVETLTEPVTVKARIRYRHREDEALVSPLGRGRVSVRFRRPQRAITPGQSVVFYLDDVVLGGGTIEKVLE